MKLAETSKTADLQTRLREVEGHNGELLIRLRQAKEREARLRGDLINMQKIIESSANFAAYRMAMDSDFSSHDIGPLLTSQEPEHEYWAAKTSYVSPNFEELTGISEVNEPKKWYSYLHPDDISIFIDGQAALEAQNEITVIYRSWHKKFNQWHWFRLVLEITADPDGGPKYANGIIMDVTEYKRNEQQLRAYQERLRILDHEMLDSEEKERRRIAGLLHDSLGQKLFALKWELEHMSGHEPGQAPSSGKAQREVEDCLTEVRSLVTELYPRELYEFGLPLALRRLSADYSRRFGIKVVCEVILEPPELPEATMIMLYRAVSELLGNVVKHANATKVQLNLWAGLDSLLITVVDDGAGFEYSGASSVDLAGLGLFAIQERLRRSGGEMTITPKEDGGTQVTLQVPLSP